MRSILPSLALVAVGMLGCDSSTVPEPGKLAVKLVPTHVSTWGGSDGAVDLTVSGGTPPYQFLWSNGETTEDISALPAGIYRVTVNDSRSLVKTDSCEVTQPAAVPESLAYLGQDPPGMVPERFSPPGLLANSEWFWHGPPSFSPDGREMYWTKAIRNPFALEVSYVAVTGDRWAEPQTASFVSQHGENNPVFSFDGQKLLFVSHRPGGFIFVMNRTESGWTDPEPLDIPVAASQFPGWQFSLAMDGTIYFELWGDYGSQAPDLYSSESVGGDYMEPVKVDAVNTASNEFAPYVHPDEEYIIFVSNRPGGFGMHDLYVSFREHDGDWGAPVNMGAAINTYHEDSAPIVSPDGNYFFFTTQKAGDLGYNPYWVDSQIIETLRPNK